MIEDLILRITRIKNDILGVDEDFDIQAIVKENEIAIKVEVIDKIIKLKVPIIQDFIEKMNVDDSALILEAFATKVSNWKLKSKALD